MYLNAHTGKYVTARRSLAALSGDSPTGEKTGFMSFSQASIIGDISFLLLCGVGVMLIFPSIGPLGQKLKGIASR